jgi:hypothetical protein
MLGYLVERHHRGVRIVRSYLRFRQARAAAASFGFVRGHPFCPSRRASFRATAHNHEDSSKPAYQSNLAAVALTAQTVFNRYKRLFAVRVSSAGDALAASVFGRIGVL